MDSQIEYNIEDKQNQLIQELLANGKILKSVPHSTYLTAYKMQPSDLVRFLCYEHARQLLSEAAFLASDALAATIETQQDLRSEALLYAIRSYQVCPVYADINQIMNVEVIRRQAAHAFESCQYSRAYELYTFVYNIAPQKLPNGDKLLARIKRHAQTECESKSEQIDQLPETEQSYAYLRMAHDFYAIGAEPQTVTHYIALASKLVEAAEDKDNLTIKINLLKAHLLLLHPSQYKFAQTKQKQPKDGRASQSRQIRHDSSPEDIQSSLIEAGIIKPERAWDTVYLDAYRKLSTAQKITNFTLAAESLNLYYTYVLNSLFSLEFGKNLASKELRQGLLGLMDAFILCPVTSRIGDFLQYRLFTEQCSADSKLGSNYAISMACYDFLSNINPQAKQACKESLALLKEATASQLTALNKLAADEGIDPHTRAWHCLDAARSYYLLKQDPQNVIRNITKAKHLAAQSAKEGGVLNAIDYFWNRVKALEPEKYDPEFAPQQPLLLKARRRSKVQAQPVVQLRPKASAPKREALVPDRYAEVAKRDPLWAWMIEQGIGEDDEIYEWLKAKMEDLAEMTVHHAKVHIAKSLTIGNKYKKNYTFNEADLNHLVDQVCSVLIKRPWLVYCYGFLSSEQKDPRRSEARYFTDFEFSFKNTLDRCFSGERRLTDKNIVRIDCSKLDTQKLLRICDQNIKQIQSMVKSKAEDYLKRCRAKEREGNSIDTRSEIKKAEEAERCLIEKSVIHPPSAIDTPYLRFYNQLGVRQRMWHFTHASKYLDRYAALVREFLGEDPSECPQLTDSIRDIIHTYQLCPVISNIKIIANFSTLEECAQLALQTNDLVTAYEFYSFANMIGPELLKGECPNLELLKHEAKKALDAKQQNVNTLPESSRSQAYFELAYGYFVVGFRGVHIQNNLASARHYLNKSTNSVLAQKLQELSDRVEALDPNFTRKKSDPKVQALKTTAPRNETPVQRRYNEVAERDPLWAWIIEQGLGEDTKLYNWLVNRSEQLALEATSFVELRQAGCSILSKHKANPFMRDQPLFKEFKAKLSSILISKPWIVVSFAFFTEAQKSTLRTPLNTEIFKFRDSLTDILFLSTSLTKRPLTKNIVHCHADRINKDKVREVCDLYHSALREMTKDSMAEYILDRREKNAKEEEDKIRNACK